MEEVSIWRGDKVDLDLVDRQAQREFLIKVRQGEICGGAHWGGS